MLSQTSDSGPDDSWCRRLGNFPAPGWVRPSVSASIASSRAPARAARGRESHSLRTHILQAALGVATATALMVSPPGSAQGMSGGGMGHGGHGHAGQERSPAPKQPDAGGAHVPNPLRAMLGEMPKLRAELLLTSAQIAPWSSMEDALRDSVELGRSRTPTLVATSSGLNAELFVQDLADNEHALAEALARLSTTIKSALSVLTPRQSKLVRERFAAAIDAEAPGALH
ncbi:MAG: hypothetical protein ABI846_04680 [Rudaea sp.]